MNWRDKNATAASASGCEEGQRDGSDSEDLSLHTQHGTRTFALLLMLGSSFAAQGTEAASSAKPLIRGSQIALERIG